MNTHADIIAAQNAADKELSDASMNMTMARLSFADASKQIGKAADDYNLAGVRLANAFKTLQELM